MRSFSPLALLPVGSLLLLLLVSTVSADNDVLELIERLITRIDALESQVEDLQDAQLCLPIVEIEDVIDEVTLETIDRIVTCKYRDEVDHVELSEATLRVDEYAEFNDVVYINDNIKFTEEADCMPYYNKTEQLCYYYDYITFYDGDIYFEDIVVFYDPVEFRDDVYIDLDEDETFHIFGKGQMIIETDKILEVKTKAFFSDDDGVVIKNDLKITDG